MISVCLATYNGEKYILEQVFSILNQLNEKDELIICDDCSTDNTLKILKKIEDKRICIIENPSKLGHVNNFEKALSFSKGDYIFLSDQDDVWLPNKVDNMIKYLCDYDLVICSYTLVDEKLVIIANHTVNFNFGKLGFIDSLRGKNNFLGCCMGMNRRLLNSILPFPPKINAHDVWIGAYASFVGTAFQLKEKHILFRRHDSNLSIISGKDIAIVRKSPFPLWIILMRKFFLLVKIILRYVWNTWYNRR